MTAVWLRSKLTLTRTIVAANLLIALVSWALVHLGKSDFIWNYFRLRQGDLSEGKIWELFSYMWVHAPLSGAWTFHLLFNMVTMASVGKAVEERLGPRNLALIYLGGGVFAGLCALLEMKLRQMLGVPGASSLIGASGAIMAVIAAFAWVYPDVKVLAFPIPAPIQARKMVCWLLGISWLLLLVWPESFISHSAHIGGLVWGLAFMWAMDRPSPRGRRLRSRSIQAYGEFPPELEDPVDGWDEDRLRVELDGVLEKIHRLGMDSLSQRERTILDRARHLL